MQIIGGEERRGRLAGINLIQTLNYSPTYNIITIKIPFKTQGSS